MTSLVPLPSQPEGVPWPTDSWPVATTKANAELESLLDEMFDDHERYETTYAAVVVQGGRLVAERYAGALEHWDRPAEPVTPQTRLLSWSMAKSMLHALVGLLVGDGVLDVDAPAAVPAWQTDDDPRRTITLEQLLEMRDGLGFLEDYVDGEVSDVIEMLFGEGKDDVAKYATSRPARHEPGTVFNYSSGTSNIVARIVCDALGDRAAFDHYFRQRLTAPIGMHSAEPRFDQAGTFIGSSFVYATALDFARFGLLYLRDGVWDGRRLLPEGWVDHGRLPRSVDPTDGRLHGAHWWVLDDDLGSFRASGYDGQSILCVPGSDLVVVRLGKTRDRGVDHLAAWRARVTAAMSG
jgi:CubicO group peptidase (beta-lactamase class C family)